jgi:hypothetical protein
MTETAYRRRRFLEPAAYESPISEFAYEKSFVSWIQAAQAYEVSSRLDGHREAITSLVDSAHWILELEDNWDREGATGYQRATLDRASTLVRAIADCCWDYEGCALPLPAINPADEGSMDLSWDCQISLLINVPSDPELPPTFAALGPDLELYGSVTRKVLPTLVDLVRNGA